jgi:hypothetical protein
MIIAHLSDVHIRKTRRHLEYKKVLDNLIASLESFNVDRVVILHLFVRSYRSTNVIV